MKSSVFLYITSEECVGEVIFAGLLQRTSLRLLTKSYTKSPEIPSLFGKPLFFLTNPTISGINSGITRRAYFWQTATDTSSSLFFKEYDREWDFEVRPPLQAITFIMLKKV